MIDTDEYEGYTYRRVDTDEYEGYTIYRRDKLGTYAGTDRYVWSYFACELPSWASEADSRLMEDAPKLLAEVKRLYKVMDVLKDFHLVKNVEQGFTQREWVELVELVKRGEEE